MSLKRITDPTTYSVQIGELKEFLRLRASTAEDYMLRGIIQTVERYGENLMKRSICQQKWRLTLDGIPSNNVIELPRPPLSTITSAISTFAYTDSTGGSTIFPSTCYNTDTASEPARIYLAYDSDWPTNIRSHKDVIWVEYWGGYGSPGQVPEPIKTWVKLRAAAYYQNRESLMVGSGNFISELPRTYVDGLLDEFVVITTS